MGKPVRRPSNSFLHSVPWIGVIGSILIFFSWLFQNQNMASATQDRLYLERSQLAIDLQQMRMENWQCLYVEEDSKAQPDSTILAGAAFKILQSMLNLNAWSSARIEHDAARRSALFVQKKASEQTIAGWYQRGNMAALLSDMKRAASISDQYMLPDAYTEVFGSEYAKVARREAIFTLLFILLYVVGSCMVGFNFMIVVRHSKEVAARDSA